MIFLVKSIDHTCIIFYTGYLIRIEWYVVFTRVSVIGCWWRLCSLFLILRIRASEVVILNLRHRKLLGCRFLIVSKRCLNSLPKIWIISILSRDCVCTHFWLLITLRFLLIELSALLLHHSLVSLLFIIVWINCRRTGLLRKQMFNFFKWNLRNTSYGLDWVFDQ